MSLNKTTCNCRTCKKDRMFKETGTYCLSTLGSGEISSAFVKDKIVNGDIDGFIDLFLGGLAQQITAHTGSTHPIGETMANRIRNDLAVLIHQVYDISTNHNA